jgi:chromosome segregation ATPase
MTQATDTDIRELKTAIDGNTRAIATQSERIEVIGHSTEANTKAIEIIGHSTEANTKAIEIIGRSTEANTKAIEAMDRRIESLARSTESNTKAIADLTSATESNAKAIADLTSSVIGLREEMRVGFAQVDTKLTKLEGKIDNVETKFDERTKGIGQRLDGKELAVRNLSTGLIVATIGGLWLAFAKFLFFGISIKP